MNNEEKILEMLENQGRLLGEIATGQAALEGRMGRLESEQKFLKLSMSNLEHRQAAFEGRIGRLEEGQTTAAAQMEKIGTDISGIKVRLDADIQKQLDVLEEGDEALADKLDRMDRTLEKVEQMAEETADKMDVVYTVVRQHSTDITELKRAQ